MLDQAIRKNRVLGEHHKINKAIILYLREHKVPSGKQPTPEEKQYLEELGGSLQLVNTQLAALAKDVDSSNARESRLYSSTRPR
jgi:hypothetical protein